MSCNLSEKNLTVNREKPKDQPEIQNQLDDINKSFSSKTKVNSASSDAKLQRQRFTYSEEPKESFKVRELCPTKKPPIRIHQEFSDMETILSKITSLQRLICSLLDLLMSNFLQEKLYETPAEMEKCRKRSEDFFKMFTRNHAYPIELLMDEILLNKNFSPVVFATKVLSLYNFLQAALSSYVYSMKHLLNIDVPSKIMDLLNFVRITIKMCSKRMLFDEEDNIAELLLIKVNEVLSNLGAIRCSLKEQEKSSVKNSKKQTRHLKTTRRLPIQPRQKNKIKTVSHSKNIQIALDRGDQQSQPQSTHNTLSRSYDIISSATKYKTPLKDKLMKAKCEFNDKKKFGGTNETTVSSYRFLPNKHTSVDDFTSGENRKDSGFIIQKEDLFKTKQITSSDVNTKGNSQIIKTGKKSKKLLKRISEELNNVPIQLDFGEKLFIENFLALEIIT
ncbi:uncharacterized protein LOC116341400 isoform X2 [Contarinia nasturtii]|nr:uncharacterized protein LOC116341400 isoform X2 [Contarinia nasturtii]